MHNLLMMELSYKTALEREAIDADYGRSVSRTEKFSTDLLMCAICCFVLIFI